MTDTTPNARAKAMLDQLNHALGDRDFAAASRLFADECYWRDLVLLTWNIKTMEGRSQIADMLAAQLDAAAPVRLSLDERETVEEADGVVSAWIVLDTRHARGGGHVRIRDGRIWTLLTAAQELKGHEEPMGTRRPMGAEHGIRRGRQTWLERRQQEAQELGRDRQPFVLVIGGGQGGIAARFGVCGVGLQSDLYVAVGGKQGLGPFDHRRHRFGRHQRRRPAAEEDGGQTPGADQAALRLHVRQDGLNQPDLLLDPAPVAHDVEVAIGTDAGAVGPVDVEGEGILLVPIASLAEEGGLGDGLSQSAPP